MNVELRFPFFSLLPWYLSLSQLENYAALTEDGADPQLCMQLLKDKLRGHSVQSWTKTDPRSVSICASSAFQLLRKIWCLPTLSRLWLFFNSFSSYQKQSNQRTLSLCWLTERGEKEYVWLQVVLTVGMVMSPFHLKWPHCCSFFLATNRFMDLF